MAEVIENSQLLDSTGTSLPMVVCFYIAQRTASNALAEGRPMPNVECFLLFDVDFHISVIWLRWC